MTRFLIHVAAAVVALAAAGCQTWTWGPTWSEVSGAHAYDVTKMYLRPAIIEQVDNQGAFASYPIKLEPGTHVITIQGPYRQPGGGFLKTITVDMEPCKRYFVNAQFKNNVVPSEFEPVVTYVETIAGCGETVAAK